MAVDYTIIIQVLISAICTGGLYGLFASGFTFQLSALNIVDTSYGAWLMVAMYLTYTLKIKMQMPFVVSLLAVMVLFFFIGYFMRRVIIAKCSGHMAQLVATMAITFIILNLMEFIYEATPRSTNILEKVLLIGGIPVSLTRLGIFVLSMAVLLGFQAFLNFTWTGRSIRALVQDSEVARVMGVNVERTLNVAYGASYMLAAISGCMLAVFIPITPHSGNYYQTLSFIICIAAGQTRLKGALYIGIIIGIMEAFLQYTVARYSMPIIFTAFVLALLFRPNGLFTRKTVKA
jgi:branched-chain amino acid transport system permease protein